MVLGAIPSSGLTENSPLLAKVVGMVIAALAAINYTAQRTALKRVYLAAGTGTFPPQISRVPQLAASALLVAAVAALAVVPASCTGGLNCKDPKNAQNIGCAIDNAVVDCTGVTSLPSAVTVVTPIVEKLIASALQADGTIKWSAIEPQLIDLALQYGMCVIAEVWNQLMNGGGGGSGSGSGSSGGSGSGSGSGSAMVARGALPAASLAEEFNRLRARVAPGRQFKTSKGAL
jgi:hypothetical protein